MSITETLANLSITWVLIIVACLVALRFALLRWVKTPTSKSIAEIAESLAVAMALVFLLIRPFLVQAFYIPSASMHPTLLESDHIIVNKLIYRLRDPKFKDVVVFKSPPEALADEKDFIKRVIGLPGDLVRITPGYVLIGNGQYDHTALRSLLAGHDDTVKLVGNKVYVNGKVVTDREIAAEAGQPNAKVKVFPGTVYINDKPLVEPYTAEDPDKAYPISTTPDQSAIVTNSHKQREVKIPKGKILVMGDNRNDSNDARIWGLLDRSRVEGKAMFKFWPPGRIGLVR